MTFTFIANPTKKEHKPERYKAVLLLDGGLSQMLPNDSDITIDEFKKDKQQLAKDYGAKFEEK